MRAHKHDQAFVIRIMGITETNQSRHFALVKERHLHGRLLSCGLPWLDTMRNMLLRRRKMVTAGVLEITPRTQQR